MRGGVDSPPCVCLGGPRHRWVYLLDHLDQLRRAADRMGRRFNYERTETRDGHGRIIWRWVGPIDWTPPGSTYDPELAYWHSAPKG